MKKIFFNNICVSISDKVAFGDVFIVKSREDVIEICDMLKNETINYDITLRGYKKSEIFTDFKSCFRFIDAAGGIVFHDNKYLLIKRLGLWDLPKGKTEGKETIRETAIREVEEETGVRNLRIVKELKPTYHIFVTKSGWKFKKTYWYLMNTKSEKKLIPQKNEDITKAVWKSKKDAAKAISGSYRSIAETFSYIFE